VSDAQKPILTTANARQAAPARRWMIGLFAALLACALGAYVYFSGVVAPDPPVVATATDAAPARQVKALGEVLPI
jgi:multidrug efflux pump subunit AcrA (membrane-fusion protein)